MFYTLFSGEKVAITNSLAFHKTTLEWVLTGRVLNMCREPKKVENLWSRLSASVCANNSTINSGLSLFISKSSVRKDESEQHFKKTYYRDDSGQLVFRILKFLQKKEKRIKLECLICGSVFDDDYRSKHKNNIHGGKRVPTVETDTDLKSSKEECPIFPNTSCDKEIQSFPMSIQSETITSGSMYLFDCESVVSLCKIETLSKISLKPLKKKKIEHGLKNEIPFDLSLTNNDPPAQPELTAFALTNKRHFFSSWYSLYRWIEYSIINDSVYCFPCRHFTAHMISPGEVKGNIPFIDYDLKCWKEPRKKFTSHSNNKRHIICMEPRVQDITENRKHMFLLKATLFFAKQGLAFRGHNETNNSNNKGNFIQLLKMFADESLTVKLKSRYGHYTSPEYQNDLIHIIASCTRKNILSTISSIGVYTILVDETKDISKKEQLSFILRFVDSDYNVHETQCYDGANVMSGSYSGVQKRIQAIVPHSLYVHCYAYRLNLCLIHTLSSLSIITNFFNSIQIFDEWANKIRIISGSSKKKKLDVIHLERLDDTRWSYWYNSLKKINLRYTEIREVLNILQNDSEEKCRIFSTGFLKEISSFNFILILCTMEKILEVIHCASCELQNSSLLLPVAINLIKCTKKNVLLMRSDDVWITIEKLAHDKAMKNGIEGPSSELRPQRIKHFNKNLNEYYVTTRRGSIWHNNWLQDKQLPSLPLEALKRCDPDCFSGIYLLTKILITLLATGATAERKFSSLRRIKTWMRSRISEERLSGLALLHAHRDAEINHDEVIDIFAQSTNRRLDFLIFLVTFLAIKPEV
ncbi:hypothetical protein AGLY_015521 [Aphis glycines]|uniref:DUF4371 domain-containing protein n=1 Tax=Aphis glycines TaxID=307491 RepID=A0A6G0T0J2_APHGL|nr:hypothetical protein AGLY_015521 [Aphis glycines]